MTALAGLGLRRGGETPIFCRCTASQSGKAWTKSTILLTDPFKYEWLRQAITNWRQVQQTLKEMQRLSREVLFTTVPHPPRRKRLGKKVLGLI
jgi:hypothetical protein